MNCRDTSSRQPAVSFDALVALFLFVASTDFHSAWKLTTVLAVIETWCANRRVPRVETQEQFLQQLHRGSLRSLTSVMFPAVGASSVGKSMFGANSSCGQKTFINSEGMISSPNYPEPYPNRASCTWKIITTPGTVLNININDLDIEGDGSCRQPSCCLRNWLSVSVDGGGRNEKFCGRRSGPITITVKQQLTVVKFLASSINKGHKGFTLSYFVTTERWPSKCPADEVLCANGQCAKNSTVCSICLDRNQLPCGGDGNRCYHKSQRCDGIEDCPNRKDEVDCPVCGPDEFPCADGQQCYHQKQMCDKVRDCTDYTDEVSCPGHCADGDGLARCGISSANCFRPKTDLCNGRFDCPDGEDEIGCNPFCPEQFNCSSGKRCYSPEQRCDGIQDCFDGSDEFCPRGFQDRFRCDNRVWVPQYLCCNGVDNCGDNSDEQNCIKTSVITAAIMGSLLCGLLLVIAVGCMCRLYSLRVANSSTYRVYHHDDHLEPPRMPTHQVDEEFFTREPPPAYNVAVSGCPLQRLPPPPPPQGGRSHGGAPRRTSRRSSNRRRSHRDRVPVSPGAMPLQMPQTALPEGSQRPPPVISEGKQMDTIPEDDGESSRCPASPSSSSESPSRDSVTSSASLVSFLSGDDDVPLLV